MTTPDPDDLPPLPPGLELPGQEGQGGLGEDGSAPEFSAGDFPAPDLPAGDFPAPDFPAGDLPAPDMDLPGGLDLPGGMDLPTPGMAAPEMPGMDLSGTDLPGMGGPSPDLPGTAPASSGLPAFGGEAPVLERRDDTGGAKFKRSIYALPVTVDVVVGSARPTVTELLGLDEGSLLALDRGIDDPVDLSVDGRIIARGELVEMDEGGIGVRITQVVDVAADALG